MCCPCVAGDFMEIFTSFPMDSETGMRSLSALILP